MDYTACNGNMIYEVENTFSSNYLVEYKEV